MQRIFCSRISHRINVHSHADTVYAIESHNGSARRGTGSSHASMDGVRRSTHGDFGYTVGIHGSDILDAHNHTNASNRWRSSPKESGATQSELPTSFFSSEFPPFRLLDVLKARML